MKTRKVDPVKFCVHCGKRLERKRYNGRLEDSGTFGRRKFCDQMCMAQHQIKTHATTSAMHRRATRYRKKTCQKCGKAANLHVHHIDKDVSNNSPENLLTLCGSCHGKWHWDHDKTSGVPKKYCSVCGERAGKLGMCQKHYQRFRKYGDPCLTKKKHGSRYVLCREAPGVQSAQASHA